jgi:hypothetical protein
MSDSLYERCRELLTGEALSAEEKEVLVAGSFRSFLDRRNSHAAGSDNTSS